ncbi:hypothetical protein [Streptomyces sp. NPDC006285]|uniref:hypothetical protein n=1 Tax=Streptomyces sp. NPDC006285 TaxID=3364742 RepID=UPI0036B7A688
MTALSLSIVANTRALRGHRIRVTGPAGPKVAATRPEMPLSSCGLVTVTVQ